MASKTTPPTIFLDFDGVLHPADYLRFAEINGELVIDHDLRCCWANILYDLIKDSLCRLVVHSSWRESNSVEQIRAMLPEKLRRHVVATTRGAGRHASIQRYIEQNDVKQYLILDDAGDEFPEDCRQLVLCESDRGISCTSVQAAISAFLIKNEIT